MMELGRTILLVSALLAAGVAGSGCGGSAEPGAAQDSSATLDVNAATDAPAALEDEGSDHPDSGPLTDITSEALQVQALDDGSYVCTPAGSGPFPGVLYNHGGLGMAVGGDLMGTCEALAQAGYVGYSKARRLTESPSVLGHIDDVYDGLEAMLAIDVVDTARIGILGFSRGGMLTLQAAVERPQAFSAIVTMAPASVKGKLDEVLESADKIGAPVLVLVSENDLFQDDHVALAQAVVDALEAAGKPVERLLYGPFGDDGHERFFVVGSYWDDILIFLATHLE